MTELIVRIQYEMNGELDHMRRQLRWLAQFSDGPDYDFIKRGTIRNINWYRTHIIHAIKLVIEHIESGEFDDPSSHCQMLCFYDWFIFTLGKCSKLTAAVTKYRAEVVAPQRIREYKERIQVLRVFTNLPEDTIYYIMSYINTDTRVVSDNDLYKLATT